MATHCSILAWRIPWTVGPGGLQSTGLQRAGHDLAIQQQQQRTQNRIWAGTPLKATLLSGPLLSQLLRVLHFPLQCGSWVWEEKPPPRSPRAHQGGHTREGTPGSGGKEGTRTQEAGLGPASDSHQRCPWALGAFHVTLPFDLGSMQAVMGEMC